MKSENTVREHLRCQGTQVIGSDLFLLYYYKIGVTESLDIYDFPEEITISIFVSLPL